MYAWGGRQVVLVAAVTMVVAVGVVVAPEVRVGVCFERSLTLLARPFLSAECGFCGVPPSCVTI